MHFLIVLGLVFGTASAFANKLTLSPTINKVEAKDVAAVWGEWLKDKSNKFDVRLGIENKSKAGIIVLLQDMDCAKGKAKGKMKHTFFNTGERTIDFQPGEIKSFNMVCRLAFPATGYMEVRVAKVYANPNGDGKTRGKVIAENLVWKPEL